jgi:1-acyl-sn-glycerol-3-phosphate acyltransferase
LLRALGCSLRLAGALARAAFRISFQSADPCDAVHRVSRELVRILDIRLHVAGEVPPEGLIVCNHLGYLDIVVLATTCPTLFVAKSEVGRWPAFGWFARRMGCIFAQRGRPSSAGRTSRAIEEALEGGRRVVLFPEGTSSGGGTVLAFRSSLLQSAVGRRVTVASVGYSLEAGDGDVARDVCYWGEMTLLPHLIRLMSKRCVRARLAFAPFEGETSDRKHLALALRAEVASLLGHPEGVGEAGATSRGSGGGRPATHALV